MRFSALCQTTERSLFQQENCEFNHQIGVRFLLHDSWEKMRTGNTASENQWKHIWLSDEFRRYKNRDAKTKKKKHCNQTCTPNTLDRTDLNLILVLLDTNHFGQRQQHGHRPNRWSPVGPRKSPLCYRLALFLFIYSSKCKQRNISHLSRQTIRQKLNSNTTWWWYLDSFNFILCFWDWQSKK